MTKNWQRIIKQATAPKVLEAIYDASFRKQASTSRFNPDALLKLAQSYPGQAAANALLADGDAIERARAASMRYSFGGDKVKQNASGYTQHLNSINAGNLDALPGQKAAPQVAQANFGNGRVNTLSPQQMRGLAATNQTHNFKAPTQTPSQIASTGNVAKKMQFASLGPAHAQAQATGQPVIPGVQGPPGQLASARPSALGKTAPQVAAMAPKPQVAQTPAGPKPLGAPQQMQNVANNFNVPKMYQNAFAAGMQQRAPQPGALAGPTPTSKPPVPQGANSPVTPPPATPTIKPIAKTGPAQTQPPAPAPGVAQTPKLPAPQPLAANKPPGMPGKPQIRGGFFA